LAKVSLPFGIVPLVELINKKGLMMKLLFGALLLVFSWYSLQILTTANVHNIQGVLEQAAPYTLLALTSGYFTLQKKVN